ncbi:MAG: VOC family protein [Dehalococcoidales bacterium]|nr:VOC family protein [Dehalococcoidales bacterium]
MTKKEKLKISQVIHICVVVADLQKSVKQYWDIYGIGPWHITTVQPPRMTDMKVRGRPVQFSMKTAITDMGNVQWELIQPLTGPSIYREFLDKHGEGVHYIGVDAGDFDKAVTTLKKHKIGILMSGSLPYVSYAYMDTGKTLGTVLELYNRPSGSQIPAAEETYPPQY